MNLEVKMSLAEIAGQFLLLQVLLFYLANFPQIKMLASLKLNPFLSCIIEITSNQTPLLLENYCPLMSHSAIAYHDFNKIEKRKIIIR